MSALVQQKANSSQTASTTATMTSAVTAKNLLVVKAETFAGNTPVTSITGTTGVTFRRAGSRFTGGNVNGVIETWYGWVPATSGASPTVIVNATGAAAVYVSVSEYSGVPVGALALYIGVDSGGVAATTIAPTLTLPAGAYLAVSDANDEAGGSGTVSGATALTSPTVTNPAYNLTPGSGSFAITYTFSSFQLQADMVVFVPAPPLQTVRRRLTLPRLRRRPPTPRPVPTAIVVTGQAVPPQGQRDRPIIFPRRRPARPQPVPTAVVVTTQALPPQSQRDRPILFPRRRPVRQQPVPTATVVVTTQLLPPQGQRDRPIVFPRRRVARQQPVPTAVVVTAALPPQQRVRRLPLLPLRRPRTAAPVPVVVQVTVTVPPPQPRRPRAWLPVRPRRTTPVPTSVTVTAPAVPLAFDLPAGRSLRPLAAPDGTWRFTAIPQPGEKEIDLSGAYARELTLRLGPGVVSEGKFTLPARSPVAAQLFPYATEVFCYRREQGRFVLYLRGRLQLPDSDELGPDGATRTFRFVDYRGRYDQVPLRISECDEVRVATVQGDPMGGTFRFSYGGQNTAAIAWPPTIFAIQSALSALPNVGIPHLTIEANLSADGVHSTGPFTLTFDYLAGRGALGVTALLISSKQHVTLGGPAVGQPFTLTYAGATTAALPGNASDQDVSTALNNLTTIGGSNASVSGPEGGPWTVTFDKPAQVAVLTGTTTATGGTVTVTQEPTGIVVTSKPSTQITIAGIDTGDIPRRLLAALNARPGMTGSPAALATAAQIPGPLVHNANPQTFQAGQSFTGCVDQLAQQDAGFDWDIDETLTYRVWPGGRGVARATPWRLGEQIADIQASYGTYANAITATGGTNSKGDQVGPVTVTAADIATRPEGLVEITLSNNAITDLATLTGWARYQLGIYGGIQATYVCLLRPGRWGGRNDLYLGDTVTLQGRSGARVINTPVRCTEIDIDIDDNTAREQVTPVFGRPATSGRGHVNFRGVLSSIVQRITTLERIT